MQAASIDSQANKEPAKRGKRAAGTSNAETASKVQPSMTADEECSSKGEKARAGALKKIRATAAKTKLPDTRKGRQEVDKAVPPARATRSHDTRSEDVPMKTRRYVPLDFSIPGKTFYGTVDEPMLNVSVTRY